MGRGVYFKDPLYAFLLYRIDIFVCRYEYIHVFFYFLHFSQIKTFTFCIQKQLSNINIYITFRRGKTMTNERTDLIYMLDNCYEPIT